MKHAIAIALVLSACGGKSRTADQTPDLTVDEAAVPAATATLAARSGSQVTGTASFVETAGGVEVTIVVQGATPGAHGLHLHETGDCTSGDAKSAGAHFNPDATEHGAPAAMPHHGGDMGNITVADDGTGTLTITLPGLTVAPGPHSVVGRALILHANEDDLVSQPAGDAGDRIACGVVE